MGKGISNDSRDLMQSNTKEGSDRKQEPLGHSQFNLVRSNQEIIRSEQSIENLKQLPRIWCMSCITKR